MLRRSCLRLLGGAAFVWPLVARAQQSNKVSKVGFLYPGPAIAAPSRIAALLDGLRGAGYHAPDQVELIARLTDGDPSRLAPMSAELIERKVDVIVPLSGPAVQVARSGTTTIPIVALDFENDAVGSGMVASLARPGGNITGLFFDFPEFSVKWLELLKETVPQLSSVAVLWDPATGPMQMKAVELAAKILNLKLEILEVRMGARLEDAFAFATRQGVGALLMLSSTVFGGNMRQIADLAKAHRFPAVTLFTEFARVGGLMAYGPNLHEAIRQVGGMVGKVLRGTNPAVLPIELPTRFELVINLRAAKALGISIPQSILARADEVIE